MREDSEKRMSLKGKVLGGKYRVEKPLGEGKKGSLFLASDKMTNKRVVIKSLLSKAFDQSGLLKRFWGVEGELGSVSRPEKGRFYHRNVVEIYDIFKDAGAVNIVLEYLEGASLGTLLQGERDKRLSVAETLEYMLPAMYGVAALHRAHIIHHNLTLDSVVITKASFNTPSTSKVIHSYVDKLAIKKMEKMGIGQMLLPIETQGSSCPLSNSVTPVRLTSDQTFLLLA